MSFLRKYTVRQYTSDDSFTRLNNVPFWVKEIQVALAFARDYDSHGKSTNGKFKPYWNLEKVTPTVISEFKKRSLPFQVKFFLTIGGRDQRYPFSVTCAEKASWVSNATHSLTAIIQQYNLDGIDIYYEHITSDEFVDTMGQLIANLKKNGAITVASIAPSAPLDANYYYHLYQKCRDDIGTVVYQCHTEEIPITTISGLMNLFSKIATQFYPNKKLLAGYSTLPRDWYTVSVPLYFVAVGLLLVRKVVFGTSIYTVSDESVTKGVVETTGLAPSIEPQWVLELVSLAITHN